LGNVFFLSFLWLDCRLNLDTSHFFFDLFLLPPSSVVVSNGKIARVHPLSPAAASTNLAGAAALATGRKRSAILVFEKGGEGGSRSIIVGPGAVDAHVHANEPGREKWEGLASASAAAAAGGITTIVDMPLNSAPAATSAELLRAKAEAVEKVRRRGEEVNKEDEGGKEKKEKGVGGLSCDVGLWGGLVPSNAHNPQELARMFAARGVLGFKAFLSPSGIGDFERTSVAEAEAAMAVFQELGAPLLLHAELLPEHRENNRDIKEEGKEALEITDLQSWAASRPEEMEVAAVEEVVAALARVVSAAAEKEKKNTSSSSSFRVHIAHVAAPAVLPLIAEAKAKGLPLSAETCPHYLGLLDPSSPPRRDEDDDESSEKEDKKPKTILPPSLLKCAPPLRADVSAVASKKLWEALEEGVLDLVASDHSPTTPEMKRHGREKKKEDDDEDGSESDKNQNQNQTSFAKAWGGISGLQFLHPLTWSSSRTTPDTIEEENALAIKLHRWLSSAPAALAGLSKRKGAISEGFDADFVVWRPRELADVSVAGCRLRHCENSPFVGTGGDLELRGRVVATFLRGQLVFSSEEEEGEEKKKLGGARLSGCGGRLLERDA